MTSKKDFSFDERNWQQQSDDANGCNRCKPLKCTRHKPRMNRFLSWGRNQYKALIPLTDIINSRFQDRDWYFMCHQNARRELLIIDGAGAGRFLTALLLLSIINGVSIKNTSNPQVSNLSWRWRAHIQTSHLIKGHTMCAPFLSFSLAQIRIITAQIAKLFTA